MPVEMNSVRMIRDRSLGLVASKQAVGSHWQSLAVTGLRPARPRISIGSRHPEVLVGDEVEDHLLADWCEAGQAGVAPQTFNVHLLGISHTPHGLHGPLNGGGGS